MSTEGDGQNEFSTKWEGFSNYNRVSDRIARSVHEAIQAYAVIESRHAENARVKAHHAAEARSKILAAALRLKVEMGSDKNSDDFEEMLDRWEDEDGYLAQLENTQLKRRCPAWLSSFVEDIRTAGYELGYLQAGRTVTEEPDDPVEGDTERMFDNL